jgi:hypothetical protein
LLDCSVSWVGRTMCSFSPYGGVGVVIMDDSSLLWFAIYVKHHHEENVVLTLGSKGYEAFLATYRNDKGFELPVFPGYVFCRFDSSRPLPVLTTPGVLSIVSNGCVPVPIPGHKIEGVRSLSRSSVGTLSMAIFIGRDRLYSPCSRQGCPCL